MSSLVICQAKADVGAKCPTLDLDLAGVGVIVAITATSAVTVFSSMALLILRDRCQLPKPNSVTLQCWVTPLESLVVSFSDQQLVTGFAILLTASVDFYSSGKQLLFQPLGRLLWYEVMVCLAAYVSCAPIFAIKKNKETLFSGLMRYCLAISSTSMGSMLFGASAMSDDRRNNATSFVVLLCSNVVMWACCSLRFYYLKNFLIFLALHVVGAAAMWGMRRFQHVHHFNKSAAWTTSILAIILLVIFCFFTIDPILKAPIPEPCQNSQIRIVYYACLGMHRLTRMRSQYIHQRLLPIKWRTLATILLSLLIEAFALWLMLEQRFVRQHDGERDCCLRDFAGSHWGLGQTLAVVLILIPFLGFGQVYNEAVYVAAQARIRPDPAIIREAYRDEQDLTPKPNVESNETQAQSAVPYMMSGALQFSEANSDHQDSSMDASEPNEVELPSVAVTVANVNTRVERNLNIDPESNIDAGRSSHIEDNDDDDEVDIDLPRRDTENEIGMVNISRPNHQDLETNYQGDSTQLR